MNIDICSAYITYSWMFGKFLEEKIYTYVKISLNCCYILNNTTYSMFKICWNISWKSRKLIIVCLFSFCRPSPTFFPLHYQLKLLWCVKSKRLVMSTCILHLEICLILLEYGNIQVFILKKGEIKFAFFPYKNTAFKIYSLLHCIYMYYCVVFINI
jgi:hypothetical protein